MQNLQELHELHPLTKQKGVGEGIGQGLLKNIISL